MKAYHWRHLIAERERLARIPLDVNGQDASMVNVQSLKSAGALAAPDLRAGTVSQEESGSRGAETKAGTPATKAAPRITFLAATTPGRYICVECTHYSQRQCTNPKARHPVSGEHVDAIFARKDAASCGPSGRHWDARQAVQRKPREHDDTEPMEFVPPVPVRRLTPFIDGLVVSLWDIAMGALEAPK